MDISISIVVATWNVAKILNKCLDSIISQLTDQCELIVIDGGSTDGTIDIIKSYSKHIYYHVSERDRGVYDAWNKGIAVARGKWICFLGADDVLLPDAISTYLGFLNSNENVDSYDYICSKDEYVDESGKLLSVIGSEPIWKKFRWEMNVAHVGSLHNKHNLFENEGRFDLKYRICADYDMLLRKKDGLRYLFCDSVIARMRTGGMSFSMAAVKEAYEIRKNNASLPFVLNLIKYFWDVFMFRTYMFRHRSSLTRS